MREVAYGTLARRDRRVRHLAVADHLSGEEVAESLSGIIAQHLLDALAASTDTDPDRAELGARARSMLEQSAARTLALGSPAESHRSLEVALALDPDAAERLRLHHLAARAAALASLVGAAEAHAAEAISAYRESGEDVERVDVQVALSRVLQANGRLAEALELAESTLSLAGATDGIPAADLRELHSVLGMVHRSRGDVAAQQHHLMMHLVLAEQDGSDRVLVAGLNDLSVLLADRGCRVAGVALLEQALLLSRESHQTVSLARTTNNLAANLFTHDLERARGFIAEAVTAARQVGDTYRAEVTMTNAGYVWALGGDWDRLDAELAEWLTDRVPTPASSATWVSLAAVRRARGEEVEVPELPSSEDEYDVLTSALAHALAAGVPTATQSAAVAAGCLALFGDAADEKDAEDWEVLWPPAVELQLAVGDLDAAGRLLEMGPALQAMTGQPLGQAEVLRIGGLVSLARGDDPEADLRAAETAHEAFGATYPLARTRLELARWLAAQGRAGEADPLLAQARAAFVELRASPWVDEVDALTASASS